MFIEHDNYFINPRYITDFKVDRKNFKIVFFYSSGENNSGTFQFKNEKELDDALKQIGDFLDIEKINV